LSLQQFYHDKPAHCFDTNEYINLYRSLHLSLERCKYNSNDFSYLQGNLSSFLTSNSKNLDDLKQSINRNIGGINESLCDYNLIEGIFRCIYVCAQYNKSSLTDKEIENIYNWLKPFSEKMYHNNFLERQIARL